MTKLKQVELDKKTLAITLQFEDRANLVIHEADVDTEAISGKQGGQNVNRNKNGVRLRYIIPDDYRCVAKKTRELVVKCARRRETERNKDEAFKALAEELRKYFYVKPQRKASKVSKTQKKKRLDNKKRKGQLKQSRKISSADL